MYDTALWLHIVTGYVLFAYVLIPVLIPRAAKNSATAGVLVTANRITQYLLIIGFLTGGYMVSKAGYSTLWIVVAIVLLLIMFAMGGMVTKPLKKLAQGDRSVINKAMIFSIVFFVAYLGMMAIMSAPQMLA
ncbi:hypothetical protein [Marinicrinis sediminis]|uniref:DUF2269 family protein n=1 Tax=Marinicrinis sediminis TaxID=1652465 RepID=A0ABW5RAP1_9BACL